MAPRAPAEKFVLLPHCAQGGWTALQNWSVAGVDCPALRAVLTRGPVVEPPQHLPSHRPLDRTVALLCLAVAPPSLPLCSALLLTGPPQYGSLAVCTVRPWDSLASSSGPLDVGSAESGWWWSPWPLGGQTGLENRPAPASSSTTRVLVLKASLNGRKSFLLSTLNPLCFSLYPFLLHSREDGVSRHPLWAKTPHLLEFFSLLPTSVPQ